MHLLTNEMSIDDVASMMRARQSKYKRGEQTDGKERP